MFHPADVDLLYPSYARGTLAPAFPSLRELETDQRKYPLFAKARKTVVVISAGEVLWVPGGTPHFVENLDHSIAYAGNFVDGSNYDR